jgi:protein dithiol oxidoreductase (disulfide-forming)
MNRRDFSLQLASVATVATAGAATGVQAQGAPVEGTHFVKLNTPAPVTLPAGKTIEVVEFFWYECPHCNTFEPLLEAWVKKLPPDIAFRQVPVGFTPRHQVQQRMFYALEEMGQLATLHRRIFAAIHLQNRRLGTEAEIAAFLKEQGVDSGKYAEMVKSFSVATKSNRARALHEAYKIDGVPAVGIQGRFYTAASLAGNHSNALAVADLLIQRVRKG